MPTDRNRDAPTRKISVIVATFNDADVLPTCLASIADQSYSSWGAVVVDGGSSDGTIDVLEEYDQVVDDWISEPDDGIYDAWNKGVRRADGEWVCFLGADDRFATPRVLEQIVPHLNREYPATRCVYGLVNVVDSEGTVVRTLGEPWPALRQKFLNGLMDFPHPGSMHHRSLFEDHGLFDPSYKIAGDFELLLRELRNRDAIFVPDVVMVEMAPGGNSQRLAHRPESLRETRRALIEHDVEGLHLRWWWAYTKVKFGHALGQVVGHDRLDRWLDRWWRDGGRDRPESTDRA